MHYVHWQIDRMSYLSAYLQVGWLNVQDLWLVIHNNDNDLNDSQDQGWNFCIFGGPGSEPKKIKEPKKLEV